MLQQHPELRLAVIVSTSKISFGAFDDDPSKLVLDRAFRCGGIIRIRSGGLVKAYDLFRIQFQTAAAGATTSDLVQIRDIQCQFAQVLEPRRRREAADLRYVRAPFETRHVSDTGHERVRADLESPGGQKGQLVTAGREDSENDLPFPESTALFFRQLDGRLQKVERITLPLGRERTSGANDQRD